MDNPVHTSIHPEPWDNDMTDDRLLDPKNGALAQYLLYIAQVSLDLLFLSVVLIASSAAHQSPAVPEAVQERPFVADLPSATDKQ
jgi:hypothetical protein